MPSDLSAEQRTRTVRAFLKLCIASSILQSALHLTIYWLHLSPLSSYLLALVPIAPLGAAVVGAVRKRTAETDPYVRRAYLGAMIIPGFITAMTLVLIKQSFSYRDSLGFAINNSAMALVFGGLFVFMLLMPKSMLDGRNLGDLLSPLRNKLLTPTQNRILRTAALFFVYIALSLASRVLFDNYTLNGALAYAVVLLPVLPLFGLIRIYNKYIAEEQDEFERHLFQQSTLVAFFGAIIVASAMGRLQEHALISQRAPRLLLPYSFYKIDLWINKDLFRPYSPFFFLFIQFEAIRIASLLQRRRIRKQDEKDR